MGFATGRIFDSGTGKVEDLDLDKSRSLFLEARGDDDGEDDDEDGEDSDDGEGDNEEEDYEETEDNLELNIVIEEEGSDDEGSVFGFGKLRTLNNYDDGEENEDVEEGDDYVDKED